MIRLVPRALPLRLFLVLATVLLLAQLLSAYLHFHYRGKVLFHTTEIDSAERISGIVQLLDSMSPSERERAVSALDATSLRIRLDQPPWPGIPPGERSERVRLLRRILHTHLGEERLIRVADGEVLLLAPEKTAPGQMIHGEHHGNRGMPRPMTGLGGFLGSDGSFLTQIRLSDGAWVTFNYQVPEEVFTWPRKLMWSLVVLLISVIVVALIAVRWLTRPLSQLSQAAHELGRDIDRPPLKESGSVEVRNAARAFNTMQTRLVRFLHDRTRILAAVSHDLKTPITRMRLRVEMLENKTLREKFCTDLNDMLTMVQSVLDFMRGMDSNETARAIDIDALLDSLQVDAEEAGLPLVINGSARSPYTGRPITLKRCIRNLLDNALKYGGKTSVQVEDADERLIIRVADEGPGVPEDMLEQVFEPFQRLENSRSRETGGTGLGLSIARNIARSHGGDVLLHNRPEGGLEAVLTLPR